MKQCNKKADVFKTISAKETQRRLNELRGGQMRLPNPDVILKEIDDALPKTDYTSIEWHVAKEISNEAAIEISNRSGARLISYQT